MKKYVQIGRIALFTLLVSAMPRASASWQIANSEQLGSLGRGAEVREATLSEGSQTAQLTAIVFPEKFYTLRVIDSPSPGQIKLSQVLRKSGCIAGVNGGYFHHDFRPLGLRVIRGKKTHPFETSRLLSGILIVRPDHLNIVRSKNFVAGHNLREALQCGPMLLENGLPVPGLNKERIARRTIVATDGRGHWGLCYLTSVSLADAARILMAKNLFGNWTARTALNLDGGSSSGLWAASTPAPVSRPEFGSVRDYVGLMAR